jgi:hypothetical protein
MAAPSADALKTENASRGLSKCGLNLAERPFSNLSQIVMVRVAANA